MYSRIKWKKTVIQAIVTELNQLINNVFKKQENYCLFLLFFKTAYAKVNVYARKNCKCLCIYYNYCF